MLLKQIVCGIKGHQFVGVRCERCEKFWAWVPERTADEVEAEIFRELCRMSGAK